MAEISTQAVMDAVTLALRAEYPEALILNEEATQGIQPGTFLVQLVKTEQEPLPGPRYRRMPLFDVVYFSADSAEECTRVGDTLSIVLGTVKTPGGDLLHGSGINWNIEDGVLHCMVLYPHHVFCPQEHSKMEMITVKEETLYG